MTAIGFSKMRKFNPFISSILVVLAVGICFSAFAQQKTVDSPAVVSAVASGYPAVFRALDIQGDFKVNVEIDNKGKVMSSKAVEENRPLVRKVIEAFADRWMFAADPGNNSKRHAQLTFTFRVVPKSEHALTIFYPPYHLEVQDNTEIVNTVDY